MLPITLTLPTNAGETTFSPSEIYTTAQAKFLADYADDAAVADVIYRNGDLAQMEFADTLRVISPGKAAEVSPAEIEQFIGSMARLSLAKVALMTQKAARKARLKGTGN